ncbi:hypothetical protein ACQPWY_35355 [Pseudonocardia xinjiangensis]|uniref:hypothetical protein n=1 Tax=Pseudonocardia xinjiangensis TaxID=75289 RepID=UPI003D94FDEB
MREPVVACGRRREPTTSSTARGDRLIGRGLPQGAAADVAGLPGDHAFRDALRSHVEFGSHVAVQNSHAETDDQLHPLREVPMWQWPGDTAHP